MKRGLFIALVALFVAGLALPCTAAPPRYTLTISVQGNGTTDPAPGNYDYKKNTTVSITAIPDSGYLFDHWEGDLSGSNNPESIQMSSNMSVTAVFVPEPSPTYTLTTAVVGGGTIDPAPGVHTYDENTVVTVTATDSGYWTFDHWEGALSGSTNPTTVTMDADKSVTAVFADHNPETALQRYVDKYDPNYSWSQYDSAIGFGYTQYFITMNSQQWRSASEVDRPVWQHYLIIWKGWFTGDTALMLIDGGSNGGTPPSGTEDEFGWLSLLTGIPIADLKQVPNEPLLFSDETTMRSEDEILAYSMDKYMVTQDDEWPVHLAMVKAAVRGMDTVQAKLGVDDFILVGASKRGWTTWLTAAYDDPRIICFAPLVIDILNIEAQMDHHWDCYGFYAPAVQDYAAFDLFCRMKSPIGYDALQIIDPYEYIGESSAYNLPKFMVGATGDQFFIPDAMQYYYDAIPGPKHVRYAVNTDHGMEYSGAFESVLTTAQDWAVNVKNNSANPSYSWTFEPDGSIRVVAGTTPNTVRLWQGTNPNARDFRYEAVGPIFTSTTLTDQGGGVYIGAITPPAQGWTCFLVELDYGSDVKYTTPCRVLPDVEPYDGTHCQ